MRKWLLRFGLMLVLNLLACAGLVSWTLQDRTLPPKGPSAVGTRSWETPVGDRSVPTQAWFPTTGPAGEVLEDATPTVSEAPVVLFNHGALGQRQSNVSLYRELASHGLVVVAPDHPGIAMPATHVDGSTTWPREEFRSVLGTGSPETVAADPAFPEFVGELVESSRAIWAGLPDSLGVRASQRVWAGHSLGSAAALDGCRQDPDCAAVVALDGPPYGRIGGSPGALILRDPGQTVPLLVVTSENLRNLDEARSVYALLEQEIDASTGGAWWAQLEDAGHLDLTDVPLLMHAGVARALLGGEIQVGTVDQEVAMQTLVTTVRTFITRALAEGGLPPEPTREALTAGTPLHTERIVEPVLAAPAPADPSAPSEPASE